MIENPYSDISFWMQRNWSDWASVGDFGMYYWMRQEMT